MGFGATTIGGALGIGAGPVATALAAALGATGDKRPATLAAGGENLPAAISLVIVMGDDLGRALAKTGLPVIAVSPRPRRRKKGPPQIAARPEQLPFPDGCADAVFAAGLVPGGAAGLRALARLCRDGGTIGIATTGSALVRKVSPPEVLAADFMHAALVDVEQKQVGSMLLSIARVRHFEIPRARPDQVLKEEGRSGPNSVPNSDLKVDAALHNAGAGG